VAAVAVESDRDRRFLPRPCRLLGIDRHVLDHER
jgi:hypothetical protein